VLIDGIMNSFARSITLACVQSHAFRKSQSACIIMRMIFKCSILQKETIGYSKGSFNVEIKSGLATNTG
jgi:hypothetical protein